MKKLIVEVEDEDEDEDEKFDVFCKLLETLDYVSFFISEDFEEEKEREIQRRLKLIESNSMRVRPWDEAINDIF